MTASAEITQLLLFTIVWTIVWVAPLPLLGRRTELLMGLIPFVAFGMRVFAGFFVGVPEDDPVRSFARPLLDWVDGRAGFPPYQGVVDVTVALGLVWLASAFEIPRRSRIATAWIMPAVAAGASWSLWATGLPVERLLAENITAVVLACAVGGTLGAVILCTPSPIPSGLRKRATIVTAMAIPAAAGIGIGMLRLALGRLPAPEKQIPLCDVDRCRGWGVGGTVCMTRPPHISRAHAKSHISDNSPD
jgi:hypothetical protein